MVMAIKKNVPLCDDGEMREKNNFEIFFSSCKRLLSPREISRLMQARLCCVRREEKKKWVE